MSQVMWSDRTYQHLSYEYGTVQLLLMAHLKGRCWCHEHNMHCMVFFPLPTCCPELTDKLKQLWMGFFQEQKTLFLFKCRESFSFSYMPDIPTHTSSLVQQQELWSNMWLISNQFLPLNGFTDFFRTLTLALVFPFSCLPLAFYLYSLYLVFIPKILIMFM